VRRDERIENTFNEFLPDSGTVLTGDW